MTVKPTSYEAVVSEKSSLIDRQNKAGSSSTTHELHHENSQYDIAQTATIPSEIANITKNLIGGGVLSLSAGIAHFADSPIASIYATVCVFVLGAVLGYFCLLIGKCCEMTRSSTYREAWERTVGIRGGMAVAVVNTLDPLLGLFGNATIMAQSLQLMLKGLGVQWTVVECLLMITLVAILPLCLMRNLSALAPYSTAGLAAVVFALAVMILRYFDGSYQPDGVFYQDLTPKMRPSFGTRNRPWSMQALPFVCMVYTSFDMHYNSPRYYVELKNASIPRFGKAVFYSFAAGSFLLSAIAVPGFLTFGENCDSFILNNYSHKDPLAFLSRLAIGLCALVAYPLNFIGLRNNCIDIFSIADKINTPTKFNAFTTVLLFILTTISCFVTDLGLINSIGGGTTVTLVVFVFPGLMYRSLCSGAATERLEVRIVMILMVIGVILGLLGVWDSIVVALKQ